MRLASPRVPAGAMLPAPDQDAVALRCGAAAVVSSAPWAASEDANAPLRREERGGGAAARVEEEGGGRGVPWVLEAPLELFYRLNHARQSLDFARRQRANFCGAVERWRGSVWDAFALLDELREYDFTLHYGIEMVACEGKAPSQLLHAFRTAELLRASNPADDWFHLAGLMHTLGNLLAHQAFGAEPQWCVVGETFPLGCRFDSAVSFAQFFTSNPDRRKRAYSTQLGVYQPRCGLAQVEMSWSGNEFLHDVLVRNHAGLPPAALFAVRYRSFTALRRGAYRELLSDEDIQYMPYMERLADASKAAMLAPSSTPLDIDALMPYYSALIEKYVPGTLKW